MLTAAPSLMCPGRLPPGLPPPPGLELPEDLPSKKTSPEWASPASTMVPTSPWCSPLLGFQDNALPTFSDTDCEGSPGELTPSRPAHDVLSPWASGLGLFAEDKSSVAAGYSHQAFDLDFKLEGLTNLESSLASLLGDMAHGGPAEARDASTDTSTGTPGSATPLPSSPTESEDRSDDDASNSEAKESRSASPADTEGTTTRARARSAWVVEDARPQLPVEAPQAPTTALLKNIPKKVSTEQLQEALEAKDLLRQIDFLYVPMDLKMKRCNQGHAIVNFRSHEARASFEAVFHGVSAKQVFLGFSISGSCAVSEAPLQGRSANVLKLQKSGLLLSMLAGTPAWLPRVFDQNGELDKFPEESA